MEALWSLPQLLYVRFRGAQDDAVQEKYSHTRYSFSSECFHGVWWKRDATYGYIRIESSLCWRDKVYVHCHSSNVGGNFYSKIIKRIYHMMRTEWGMEKGGVRRERDWDDFFTC